MRALSEVKFAAKLTAWLWERRAHWGCAFCLAFALSWCVSTSLVAQTAAGDPGSSGDENGVSAGGYKIHSSIDLGYRFNDVTGSGDMYDTLVDLHQGPRILDQTLSMQSETHHGLLFDNLFVTSSGWGGDPDNFLHARVDLDKWYRFSASFRRDQNFFDYDLLANPLNPPTASPYIPVEQSPHLFETRRRMSDFDLTLLPQSKLSFRLGYSRNNVSGPDFSSTHIGTDALLSEPVNTTMNSYRLGVDWKAAPRTVVSYDQFLNYYKGDTDTYLAPFASALLPGGTPVELGLPIDPANRIPCGIPPGQTSLINSSGFLTNIACSAYFSYTRFQRIRTSSPTERLSLRSNYFNRLELTSSYAYGWADMTTPLNEAFNGLITRTGTRAYTVTGPANVNRISNVFDLGATVHLTKRLRLVDKASFWAFRIPQNANYTEIDDNIPGIGGANPCLPPACTLLTPLANTVPVATDTLVMSSFDQRWFRNQIELDYDVSKKIGVRVGYRYGDQDFNHFLDFSGDQDHFVVLEQTGLAGIWVRPLPNLRANFDVERINYGDTIVRIAPRKESRYRLQTNYTPRPWAALGGSINILEDNNNTFLTNYVGHNRNYGLTASVTPRERYGFDLAYNYGDFMQNALICFNDTPAVGVTLPFVNSAGSCVAYDPANPLLAASYYTNHTQFGMATVRFKPIKRVTANLGYSITSVDGSTPQFNILQPLGPLDYKYQQPVVGFSVDLGHHMAWNSGWNYQQYAEGSFVGPTAPRYFHANSVTESLHYAF